ncbi:Zinc finger, RING-type [Corchorus olitorius]|uniref:RING-type E3 ubiquitin transferase n=1 Tax=Corchorus olitorius TaxID=93759 RepID=A0A1R3ILY3_9ROSI|nr:Zinc finger, RING-type [Corchorus olitorius]
MSISSSPTQFSQDLLENFHSRKFLLHAEAPAVSPTQQNSLAMDTGFDSNVVIMLLVLICSLISALGLFCIVKCARNCSGLVAAADQSAPNPNPSAKLENAGVEQKALKAFPTVKYTTELKLPGLDTACVICLSEFAAGERLRILPKCNHGFHTRCIDKWLSSHSSCPTCRQSLITETDQKTVETSLPLEQSDLPVQEN